MHGRRYEIEAKIRGLAPDEAARPRSVDAEELSLCRVRYGGERAAIAYTILGCCRLADVNPVQYLTDVLPRLARGLCLRDMLGHAPGRVEGRPSGRRARRRTGRGAGQLNATSAPELPDQQARSSGWTLPRGVRRDVFDDDALAEVGGRAARPCLRADARPIDPAPELGGASGRGAVAETRVLAVDEQQRARHVTRALPFDEGRDVLQELAQRHAAPPARE
jgi:hypothetical protein